MDILLFQPFLKFSKVNCSNCLRDVGNYSTNFNYKIGWGVQYVVLLEM